MKQIFELNGYIILKGFAEEELPSWVTPSGDGKAYFLLNRTTRECFKRDLLHLVAGNQVFMTRDTYLLVRDYVPNSPILRRDIPVVVAPNGITLMPHQTKAVELMLQYYRYAFFLGTGSGKTYIAISYLLSEPEINKVLIFTPKNVIGQYTEYIKRYNLDQTKDIIVTNYEQAHKYLNTQFDCIICDESHVARNFTSIVTKTLKALAHNTKHMYLFTGTPQDKCKYEIFVQLSILDDRYMPGKTKFIERYFNTNDYYQPTTEIPARSQELVEMLSHITWGSTTEEIVALPKEIHHIIPCKTPEHYDALRKNHMLRFNIEGEEQPAIILTDTPTKLRIALRRLCNGHLDIIRYSEEGIPSILPMFTENAKLPELQKLLPNLKSAVIYTEFDEDQILIEDLLKKEGYSYEKVSGKTTHNDQRIDRFKNNEVQFLLIQSRSGNAGLDFINTSNVIFYSLPESFIIFHQSKSRIRRFGQPEDCNYYYLLCEDTVDESMYKALSKKKSYTLKLFKNYLSR